MLSRTHTRFIVIGAGAIAIGVGAYGIVSATAGNSPAAATTSTSAAATSGHPVPGRGGSNARSRPAAGGAVGTILGVPASSFALSTSAGQKLTVREASSTTYAKGTRSISASAIKKGQTVLVLGTTDGTTITASQIIVEATGSGAAASATAGVIPFQRGAQSTSKQAGQIPASYSQGSGTIVGGTTANKAVEAALAAYPGGIVDRVVELSNDDFEVHNIGVNWPHHIFVDRAFKVVGAD
jgi:membrane-bound inhibitor of C-type lysozyme